MRQVPHPLTVIVSQPTTNKSHSSSGLLVSSFNTVTLTPDPYVSFNLKLPSSTFEAIKESKRFTASAIAAVDTAKAFLNNGKGTGTDGLKDIVEDEGRLKAGKGGIWWMRCRWVEDKCQRVGDHVIVVGIVLQAGTYEITQDGSCQAALTYLDGNYRTVGSVIK